MAYTNEQLRNLFQNKFNLQDWTQFLITYFGAQTIRQRPELLDIVPSEGEGYYLGKKQTTDNYEIGLFYLKLNSSVKKRRVGLRQLIKPYLRYLVDAALVVFDDGKNWRLSFICDLKGDNTSPKRYTFVFGEPGNFYNTAVSRFLKLQQEGITFLSIKDAFSVEALTKEFYNELFGWYQWAVSEESGIYFPNDTNTATDDFEDIDKKIIRLLTRLMFVWFIKQKGLVPNNLFEESYLKKILKDFNPQSQQQGVYYNAILQNLFFATLNRAIEDEDGKRGFAKREGQRDVKTLYRYAELFKISEEEVLNVFADIPFLNGGLFECLDKTKKIDGVEKAFNYDGFSRNDNKWPNGRYRQRAFIPNVLFFDEQSGLISILKKYNFTIEENTPNEQQVALDPELLGKVFENLLGAYNPETKEAARNQSGSFYTPREIVNYMVDESLKAYLTKGKEISADVVQSLLSDNFEYDQSKALVYKEIASRLRSIKIIDPACGSGAFPMGLLNRMVDILQRIEPEQSVYELKLNIIENCIYGSDIQNIATQISKLRFFISLICDCEKDNSKPNFGIPTLPNLETKFVTANSLISLKRRKAEDQLDLFADSETNPVNIKKNELHEVRHQHFRAKTANEKMSLRRKDEKLRNELLELLAEDDVFAPEDAKQMALWNPYDQNAVAEFFDPEWMLGYGEGFDIVIGNPPYIQLQNNGGELAKLYQDQDYKTFARTGDIYCLFYERGWQLLKEEGNLCYITSNKWMRAGYGEKTREFFANKTNPMLLIDFAGVKIFESATVDTNILLFSKSNNQHETVCAVTNKQNKDSVKNLSDFVQQQNSICDFNSSDSWVILSPIEQSIKRKIEAVGTPLKDWDIQINYGIKTGFNDAFIISTEKRNEILANCRDAEERKRTEELIRPILRGRDIKRYGYDWANLYLIATFPSRHYDIDRYPAVKQYLLSFGIERLEQTGKTHIVDGEKVKARKKTNNKWFETQDSISYWEEFLKPKIIYPNMTKYMPFVFDNKLYLTNQKCFIITGKRVAYLTAFFNSSLFKYCFRDSFPELQGGTRELSKIFFDKIPVYEVSDAQNLQFQEAVEDIQNEYTKQKAQRIDSMLFDLYNLTREERKVIGFVEIV